MSTSTSTSTTEPILVENPQRFTVFPISYPSIWNYYKKAEASFWTAEEITLSDDKVDWMNKLNEEEKFFIKHILAFFASSDGIVNENLAQNFFSEIQIPEARCFYGFQIMMENIHGETYSLLIDSLVENIDEKQKLFHAIENFPSIKKLSDWAIKWFDRETHTFSERLIAFACVEGILFSGPFCSIFWFKKRGLLPGLTFSNELISRDENLHMEFACEIHRLLHNPASPDTILQIVKEAVYFEKEFIEESLPVKLIGMDSIQMSQYIEYVADRLLVMLGCPKYFMSSNPFGWMDLISTPNKTNFFEKRVAEYNRAGFRKSDSSSMTQKQESGSKFDLAEDF